MTPATHGGGTLVALRTGAALHTEDRGAGPALVFVHGLPGLAEDFRPLTERLAEGFRCVAYDRGGYGGSAPCDPRAPVDIDAHARELVDLLDALALERVHLVGWSYGGPIVMETARRARERVASLVLLGSAGPALAWPHGLTNRLLFATPLGGPLLRMALALAPAALRPALDRAYGERAPDRVFDAFVAGLRAPGALDRWLREGRSWNPAHTVPEEVAAPCLVIHGARDAQVPVSVATDLAHRLPHAEMLVLDDAGHWPFATHAAEVEVAVRRFLAAHP